MACRTRWGQTPSDGVRRADNPDRWGQSRPWGTDPVLGSDLAGFRALAWCASTASTASSGLVLILVALVWLWLAFTYIPGPRGPGETGPRAFPVLLGVALAGLGVAVALNPRPVVDAVAPFTRREALVAAGTIGVLVLYAFLLERVGFLIATPVAITLAMRGLVRERSGMRIAALAIGFTAGCWVIFGALLGTPLPRGSWVLWLR